MRFSPKAEDVLIVRGKCPACGSQFDLNQIERGDPLGRRGNIWDEFRCPSCNVKLALGSDLKIVIAIYMTFVLIVTPIIGGVAVIFIDDPFMVSIYMLAANVLAIPVLLMIAHKNKLRLRKGQ